MRPDSSDNSDVLLRPAKRTRTSSDLLDDSASLQERLVVACRKGDEKEVQQLLKQSAVAHLKLEAKQHPLGAAIWGMNPEIIITLLKETGDVSPMAWDECIRHNKEFYGQTFAFNLDKHANRLYDSYGIFGMLDDAKESSSPFLKEFILKNVKGKRDFRDITNWKTLEDVMKRNLDEAWGYAPVLFDKIQRIQRRIEGIIINSNPIKVKEQRQQALQEQQDKIKKLKEEKRSQLDEEEKMAQHKKEKQEFENQSENQQEELNRLEQELKTPRRSSDSENRNKFNTSSSSSSSFSLISNSHYSLVGSLSKSTSSNQKTSFVPLKTLIEEARTLVKALPSTDENHHKLKSIENNIGNLNFEPGKARHELELLITILRSSQEIQTNISGSTIINSSSR